MTRQAATMRCSTILLALFAAFATSAQAADAIFPSGLGVGLEPPVGMHEARAFPGFENEAAGSAIMIAEMPPDAYGKLTEAFKDDALKRQGITVDKRENWPISGGKGFLVSARQTAGAVSFRKWIVIGASEKSAAVITVQVPETSRDLYPDDAVLRALKTITFKPPRPIEEEIATLPFSLGERAGFRIARVVSGSSLLMTEGPKDFVSGAEQPIVIVAAGDGAIPGTLEQDAFARRAFNGLAGLSSPEIKRAGGLTINGATWHQMEAVAQEAQSKAKVVVLQAIRFGPTSYIRLIGMAREKDRADMVARFDRIRDAVAPKDVKAN